VSIALMPSRSVSPEPTQPQGVSAPLTKRAIFSDRTDPRAGLAPITANTSIMVHFVLRQFGLRPAINRAPPLRDDAFQAHVARSAPSIFPFATDLVRELERLRRWTNETFEPFAACFDDLVTPVLAIELEQVKGNEPSGWSTTRRDCFMQREEIRNPVFACHNRFAVYSGR